ncbi:MULTISPECIES: TetR/AcrR family transcriptional regulator [unclassified Streptomyces]|uniref:TetR/AcrR family transcriptional regulator n=1 Tax=unclassified Streptomyces TaxID=2593676 RepID=UPI00081F6FBE|nr:MULTISPECIES: TetR/AcrR family transcriptional regulator [unclassified Streptomyces]MYZ36246.1 TetR family transcriptional regulator [Streptomyces sp. SID4917]SCF82086.1 transcriptional regulator, TetR family [Streptomyces sp. MnatMP-M17]
MTTARPYHHGDLRTALLRQAERTLAEQGVDGLSLRELAREVGVSHGAPRRHFPDKRALLDALAEEGYERLGRRLDAALNDDALVDEGDRGDLGDHGDLAERLVVFAQVYVEFAVEHRALLGLMHGSKEGSRGDRLREANDRAFAAPVRLLAEARARGYIDADTTGRVDMTVLAVLQGLAVLAATGMNGAKPLGVLVSETVETLLAGLRPR